GAASSTKLTLELRAAKLDVTEVDFRVIILRPLRRLLGGLGLKLSVRPSGLSDGTRLRARGSISFDGRSRRGRLRAGRTVGGCCRGCRRGGGSRHSVTPPVGSTRSPVAGLTGIEGIPGSPGR